MNIDLRQGDCLELMKNISDESIDMILCDLPYGTTRNEWDKLIPFEKLWKQYNRIIKEHGCIALFNQEPFGSRLRMSNKSMYRYEWYLEKPTATGFLNANRMPLKANENVAIFYKRLPVYNPQFKDGKAYTRPPGKKTSNYGDYRRMITKSNGKRYPRNILKIEWNKGKSHPTEKPVKPLEYLIKTYTNEGMTVLDNCMGSGSTGVACVNTNRNFIGMELDEHYFGVAKERINEAKHRKEARQ